MIDLEHRLKIVLNRIRTAEKTAGRPEGSVTLLAVSKTYPASAIRILAAAGQPCFGENYLQEAREKQSHLSDLKLEWHFIGPLQTNKTRPVAALFDWVHSVDRWKVADRLNAQRSPALPRLNVCLEVNISGESSKSGVMPEALLDLALAVSTLPRLRLRGLMTVPNPLTEDHSHAAAPFRALSHCFEALQAQGLGLDTLSMGMSADLEAAIAEGATLVRIGTALFGPRIQMSMPGRPYQ